MTPGKSPTRRLVLAGGGMLLLPRTAHAQPARHRRIALLATGSRAAAEPLLGAFRQGLRALGYGDEDIAIESRYADGQDERLADLGAELVRLAPELIVAAAPPAIQAAKQATMTIPIVMVSSGDPVAIGFVSSLARPAGNVTGLSTVSPEMVGKWMQLLKTAIPAAERVAILVNPANLAFVPMLQVAPQPARALRLELLSVEARAADEIGGAFASLVRERAEALIVPNDAVFLSEKSRIVELAASHKLPAIYMAREFAAIGGLMSYGPDLKALWRGVATYVDRILKGAKPADLPVEQPTKFQLVINLKTAQALGLTIPPSILAGADEVIE